MSHRKTINLGIVAHADAGKTTLTEQILYQTGAIRSAGSVDDGTASTDTMEIERRRGISVRTACASVLWNGVRLNLIDTPGHADFLSEVERSLSVLDAAVLVISSVEGVQPQTRMLLEAFRRAKLPCFLFLNKLDRAGSNWQAALSQVERETGLPCLPLCSAAGEGESGVKIASLGFTDPAWTESAVLACEDDDMLEKFLSGEEISGLLRETLSQKISAAELLPAVCGASKYGLGVPELLTALCSFLQEAPPLGETLCARVYKVERDDALGKAAYVRLFSGSLQTRQTVPVLQNGAAQENVPEEKITQLRRVEGRRTEDTDTVSANDIAVVYGLSSVRAGDLLGSPLPGLREYRLAEPLMLCRVQPADPEQLPRLTEVLFQLEEEDPALHCEWNREKREIWVRLTGKIQAEVLQSLLLERWGLSATLEEPSVIYRETPVKAGEGFDAYTMPKPCWAVVRFLIEPLPRGAGFQYECKVSPNRLPYRYQTHVETAVPRALTQGLHGWQVTDLKVTLIDGESHNVHTHPLDFFVATPMGIMDGLRNVGTKLLEPILQAEFSAPEEYLGKTVSLLVAHRATFDTPEVQEGKFRLTARLPAAEAMDIPVEFAACTAGTGVYGSRFSHYEDCPEGMGRDRARIGVDPLDRSKFILASRSALSQ